MSIPRTHWISDPALLKADGVDMRWSVSRLRKAASNFVGLFGYENCGVFWFEISDQVQLFFALGLADSNCAMHTRFCHAEKLPLFRNVFSFEKICLGKKWELWTQQMESSKLALPTRLYLVFPVAGTKRLRLQLLNESKGCSDSPEYFIHLATVSFQGKDPRIQRSVLLKLIIS